MDISSVLIGMGAWLFVLAAFSAFAAVVSLVGMWKVLERLGKPGWGALVPFYGTWLFAEGAGLERNLAIALVACQALALALLLTGAGGAVAVLALLSLLSFTVLFAVACDRARSRFGYGRWMTAAMVLVPFVAFPMAGFAGGADNKERAARKQMRRSRDKEAALRSRAAQKAVSRPSVKDKGKGARGAKDVRQGRPGGPHGRHGQAPARAAASPAPDLQRRAEARERARRRFYESLDPSQQMEFDMLSSDAERSEYYRRTVAGRSDG